MKNSNYAVNGVLAVAIVVLFILHFTNGNTDKKSSENVVENVSESIGSRLPLAFVRTDSLLNNYKFFIDMNNALMKKAEDNNLIISQRAEKFRKESQEFVEKAQRNLFVSQERQKQEENRLIGVQQDLENYAAKVDREWNQERMRMNLQLQDTIVSALKQFNTPKKYEFILGNSGTENILYADDSYDITKEVIEYLNARYVPSKK